MVQPVLVRTEKELALRADYRRRAIKAHAARAAKRTESASLKLRASLPQNRTLGCEVRAQSHAQLQHSNILILIDIYTKSFLIRVQQGA